MTQGERIERYVRKHFARSGNTEWPTVRRIARALRLSQAAVEEEAFTLPLMLTMYNTEVPEPLGDCFVEICE